MVNLGNCQYEVLRRVAGALNFRVQSDREVSDCDLIWTDWAVTLDQVAKLRPHQKVNHFPGVQVLSRKDLLARQLSRFQKAFPAQYDFFPQTFLLPQDQTEFLKQFNKKRTFIIKPEAGSQGKGIYLVRRAQDVVMGENVAQKYLSKPFLIDGLKFDLRVYVLLAGSDPLRIYMYKEGTANKQVSCASPRCRTSPRPSTTSMRPASTSPTTPSTRTTPTSCSTPTRTRPMWATNARSPPCGRCWRTPA